jgi:hypothetical protein
MSGGRFGHAALAGAVGGSAIACGAATGPLLAMTFDLAAAAATAGIAAHAVEATARERGVSSAGILHRTARAAVKRSDAPLAAYAVDVACRARKGDARALRSAATLLGRAASGHARGIALQLFGSWCAPLRDLTRLAAPFGVARGALDGAAFVQAMVSAVPPEVTPVHPTPEWPFVGSFGGLSASEMPDSNVEALAREQAQDPTETQTPAHLPEWEVAA